MTFVNLYRDGQDTVTLHRDKTHGKSPIVSFSFYEDETKVAVDELRSLRVVDNKKREVDVIVMEHASAVIMLPGMQESFLHEVPVSKTAKKYRLNVTFRA